MPKFRCFAWLLPLALLASCPGCLITRHSTNVIRQDEPRREVAFESPTAQQAFSAKAFDSEAREGAARSKVVAIPFLLWWSKMDVLSEGAYYNDQVAACDTDGNGMVSVQEALAYNPMSAVDFSTTAGQPPSAPNAPAMVPYPTQPASAQQPARAPTPEDVLR